MVQLLRESFGFVLSVLVLRGKAEPCKTWTGLCIRQLWHGCEFWGCLSVELCQRGGGRIVRRDIVGFLTQMGCRGCHVEELIAEGET